MSHSLPELALRAPNSSRPTGAAYGPPIRSRPHGVFRVEIVLRGHRALEQLAAAQAAKAFVNHALADLFNGDVHGHFTHVNKQTARRMEGSSLAG